MLKRLTGTGLQEQTLAWAALAWSRQVEGPSGLPALGATSSESPHADPPPEASGLTKGASQPLGPARSQHLAAETVNQQTLGLYMPAFWLHEGISVSNHTFKLPNGPCRPRPSQ